MPSFEKDDLCSSAEYRFSMQGRIEPSRIENSQLYVAMYSLKKRIDTARGALKTSVFTTSVEDHDGVYIVGFNVMRQDMTVVESSNGYFDEEGSGHTKLIVSVGRVISEADEVYFLERQESVDDFLASLTEAPAGEIE